MLDIDDFKQVNDTYGHPAGDAVLRSIGRILKAESRGIDEPARYGGEEFVVALPETSPGGALELAERIHARIGAERTRTPDGDGDQGDGEHRRGDAAGDGDRRARADRARRTRRSTRRSGRARTGWWSPGAAPITCPAMRMERAPGVAKGPEPARRK